MKAIQSCVAVAVVLILARAAAATELIFSTGWSNWTAVESTLCGAPPSNSEAADDFDLIATVERVYVYGHNSCYAGCSAPPVTGAWVRFYAWTPTGPGALQVEHYIAGGDAGFAYNVQSPEELDITLPQPFQATGKHYVSVQLQFASCFYWAFWVANRDAPMGGAAYKRTSGGLWSPVTAYMMESCDLSFELYGTIGTPPPPKGCGTWFLRPSPNAPGMEDSILNGVARLAPDDIWAVGRAYGQATPSDWNQYTLAMHFDGAQWTIVPTPSPNPAAELTYCGLNAVAAITSNDVWAAGTRWDRVDATGYVGLHTLVMHWDGSSWLQVPTPVPTSVGLQGVSGDGIYEIHALGANDIWFLGEWIDMTQQGYTLRSALAMHWNGSGFTLHPTPTVGSNGATIYASDSSGPADIWAAGAAGDGDPAPSSSSFIYHWNGSTWAHVPFAGAPGYSHSYGGVRVLAPDDVWISGSAWAPPNEVTQFMLHWDGSSWQYHQVPFAGGKILGEPPEMYVFGYGGVSRFDGSTFTDAHLLEGLSFLSGFGFRDIVQTGSCEMLAVGFKDYAGTARTLVATLEPAGSAAGAAQPDINADGTVDGADIGILLGAWGQTSTWADLDGSGTVDGGDLGILLGSWS